MVRLDDADSDVFPGGHSSNVGFYAKLSVLQALIASGQPVHIGLAVFAVVMSLVGAFYYLRVVKVMFFDEPLDTNPLADGAGMRLLLSTNGLALLLLGLMPGGLMTLCITAMKGSL